SRVKCVGRFEDFLEGYWVRPTPKAGGPPRELDAKLACRAPGVGGVAPVATQVTLAETHEERALADVRALALDGREDLDEICRTQARQPSRMERPIAISASASSMRSGCSAAPRIRKRATWSASGKPSIQACLPARCSTMPRTSSERRVEPSSLARTKVSSPSVQDNESSAA